jgi:4-hydroxy-3-methylbut-2-enyl diphosphate reductase
MSNPLQVRVEFDGGSGFCFGAVYAIELAEALLAGRGHRYCLGR